FVQRSAGAERISNGLALLIGFSQEGTPGCSRHRLDRAPDLAARRRLVVHYQNIEPEASGRVGGRHASRACTNDEDVNVAHAVRQRLPCWRSTRIPSRTGVRQVWTEATPSTRARQSKQTPIMQ